MADDVVPAIEFPAGLRVGDGQGVARYVGITMLHGHEGTCLVEGDVLRLRDWLNEWLITVAAPEGPDAR